MPAKIKIKDIELTSDSTAIVTYHKHTPIADFDGNLDMVLQNGQWKAHIAGIYIPEKAKQAVSGDTIYFNYDNIKPGDLKVVSPDSLNNFNRSN